MQAALQSFVASEAYKRSTAALAAPILRMQDILALPVSKEQLEEVLAIFGASDVTFGVFPYPACIHPVVEPFLCS